MEYKIVDRQIPIQYKNGKRIMVWFDEIIVSCKPAKNGIGEYEYWGAHGYDEGHWILEDFEIDSVIISGKLINEKFYNLIDIDWLENKYKDDIIHCYLDDNDSY